MKRGVMESVEAMWNSKFSSEGYMYGKAPNTFLKEEIDKLEPPKKILFLGEGEGRNAVYAAVKGHEAVALDVSSVGLKKAEALAKEFDVTIKTVHTDLSEWQPMEEQYDVVMSSYMHLMEPLRTEAFHKAMKALKEGGIFVGEFFSQEQLSRTSGGPKNLDLLYSVESLQSIFKAYHIVMLEALEIVLNEGTHHVGEASVIRVIVKK